MRRKKKEERRKKRQVKDKKDKTSRNVRRNGTPRSSTNRPPGPACDSWSRLGHVRVHFRSGHVSVVVRVRMRKYAVELFLCWFGRRQGEEVGVRGDRFEASKRQENGGAVC